MWTCPSCGESYFTAPTMHEIERIKALRKSLAVNLILHYGDMTDSLSLLRVIQKSALRRGALGVDVELQDSNSLRATPDWRMMD